MALFNICLEDKDSVYGDFTDVQKHCLYMILHKLSRALTGNPNFIDHWDDIAGYAKCVVQNMEN